MTNAVEVAETTLIKHSAAIHISNSLTLIQRKLFNVLLQRAYPTLLSEETHAVPLAELKAQLGYRSKNDEPIKEGFRVLNSTQVEWNVLNKDREERWGIGTCLADAEIVGGLCEYSYSPKMRKLLGSPAVYARLNLEVQNTFRSKHALALWEFLEDALGARRREAGYTITVEDFRKLMAIEEGQYSEFKGLNKRVLEPAIQDINASALCGIECSATVKRRGRVPVALAFTVRRKAEHAHRLGGSGFAITDPALVEELTDQVKGEGAEESERVRRLTEEFGVSAQRAIKLVQAHPAAVVDANLDHVAQQVRRGGVANVGGYVCAAIEQNYAKILPSVGRGPDHHHDPRAEHVATREQQQREQDRQRRVLAEEAFAKLSAEEQAELEQEFARRPECPPSLRAYLAAKREGQGAAEPPRWRPVFLEFLANHLDIAPPVA